MIYINTKIIQCISIGITIIVCLLGKFTTKAETLPKITINEVCPENNFYKAPNGNTYGWAEICNSSSHTVDMSGWGFSDDPENLRKYTLPAGTVIKSGEKKIIYCSPEYAPLDIDKDENIIILTDRAGNEIDRITFGKIPVNTSYGQYPDSSGKYFNMECTPEKSNVSPNEKIKVKEPEFSHDSGFYDNEFMLSINVPEGTTVYYTLDGSEPDINSKKYNANIRVYDKSDTPNIWSSRTDISSYGAVAPNKTVDKAFLIRAVAIDENGRKSSVVSASYFLGKTNSSYYKDMKVVSLVTDPENLFNYDTGIYVKGRIFDTQNTTGVEAWNMVANYTQKGKDWERPALIEVFDKGKKVLSQNVGIRIKGATSRSTPQKSFNIYAREEYGNEKLEYDFFDGQATNNITGKTIKSYKQITIRNAGNDVSYSYFRDNINQSLISDRTLTSQAMNACILFIDGEFWGLYTLTEKTDDNFIKSHYNIKKKNVAIIKNNQLEEGEEQDLTDWNSFIAKSARTDMTIDENYKEFCRYIDTDSLAEYFAVQIYWCNYDWPYNNFAVWRSDKIDSSNIYSDGKWRMLLFDTDFTTGLYKNSNTSYTADIFSQLNSYNDNISRTFMNLLKNQEFKQKFCTIFMDLANYNFNPEKTDKTVEYYRNKYHQQISDTNERFYSSTFTSSNGISRFDSEMDTIADFYRNRFTYASDSLRRTTGSNSLHSVTLCQNKNGSINLNTINPDISNSNWCGQYFSDYKITLKAVSKNGYKFDKWEISGTELSTTETKSAEISIIPDNDITVKAIFKKS